MTSGLAFRSEAKRRVRARASGKVNLQLSVGPLGEDGYHPLATVFQSVSLYETVTAEVRDDELITLRVVAGPELPGDVSGVPLDHTNLAWRAAEAVRNEFGVSDGIDLSILKGVPVAGGMAGGSADAAAALVACSEAWHCGANREDLYRLAAALGADVPFALMGHTAVGLGRGDELSPAMTRGDFYWVFAMQHEGLRTPEVFSRFDDQVAMGQRAAYAPHVDTEVMGALMAGDAAWLGRALSNDLQDAALSLAPRLHGVMETMYDADALGVIVSGSGPTIAALAGSAQHALSIATRVRAAGTADVILTATGPATGTVILEG
jgi:4-diphosphocytidyl-2-C-methyl-D-erythritol kinase